MSNILLIGSGGIRVGQAGEFDYSGSQAIKAFKDEGHRVILINPNIATIQTDNTMADKTYFLPLNIESVISILQVEDIEYLSLGFGGQTALNLGLELFDSGILEQYSILVIGSPIESIKETEDRELFRDILLDNDINTPISKIATNKDEAIKLANEIGYPLMMRSGFSLGGLGSGKIYTQSELEIKITQVLAVTPQVLLEEYLTGWKEFEYEIVRDVEGNALTICNMENLDPMGIHTGESIVIAPAQTLNNVVHQQFRDIALKCARIFGIIGECNIQFALNPNNGDYRVIEINPRLSRSSALASKATGYPLAYVAAKLCLGKKLYEITNNLTKSTSAFFEPALDYVVVKIPRWDTHKLTGADRQIGTEMKSVGEVMGIGRSFHEALQKAIQMLNIGATCLLDYPWEIENLENEIECATDRRIFALYQWFKNSKCIDVAHKLSGVDYWFLTQIRDIANFSQNELKKNLDYKTMLQAKQFGISDNAIAKIHNIDELDVREKRINLNIVPCIKQIDTVAGEFSAKSNYLYLTYHGSNHDLTPSFDHVCILGSGPYSIGSSVEFDWCTVNLARGLRERGQKVIIINSNPETVSTDYDESDRLYFEPLSLERVLDILDFEKCRGTAVSVGGQSANNLVMKLSELNYPILGTTAANIHRAEDRNLFSQLLHKIEIDQPKWINATSIEQINEFVNETGFPIIVRPSYVLSGSAMKVATNKSELYKYVNHAIHVSPLSSVVLSEFIENAEEIEVDLVAKNGKVIYLAISEHIENAGVHSGDATIIHPAQSLSKLIIDKIKSISYAITKELEIHGPLNMQIIKKGDSLKIIECNVRASRTFPFISKIIGVNLIKLVSDIYLDLPVEVNLNNSKLIGVKTPVFSYNRFKGSDPVAKVEMSSTGEVACLGLDLLDTFYQSWIASGQSISGKNLLISLPEFGVPEINNLLVQLGLKGWTINAGNKTFQNLNQSGVSNLKYCEDNSKLISNKTLSLVINIPENVYDAHQNNEEYLVRRGAIDYHIPLISNSNLAIMLLKAVARS